MDGTANGIKAMKFLMVLYYLCLDHQLARAVAYGTGMAGGASSSNPVVKAAHQNIITGAQAMQPHKHADGKSA